MKVRIDRSALSKALSMVDRAASHKSTLVALQHVLMDLSTEGSYLEFAGTNLQIGMRLRVPVTFEDMELEQANLAWPILMPAKRLYEWVSNMPNEPVILEVEKNCRMALKCGRFSAHINGMSADEFPLVPGIDGNTYDGWLQIPVATLRQMIKQVIYAASEDDSRPALTAVLFKYAGDEVSGALKAVTTDGYRLAVIETTVPAIGGATEWSVLIPADSLNEACRLAGEAKAEQPIAVEIGTNPDRVTFYMEGSTNGPYAVAQVTSVLVDAKFPGYEQIIPKSHKVRSVMTRAELIQALKVARLFAKDTANNVRFTVMPEKDGESAHLILTATSVETGDAVSRIDIKTMNGKGPVVVDTQYAGKPLIEIAFNCKYLTEALAVIGNDVVALETTDPNRPGVLRGMKNQTDHDPAFLYVVMPMQLTR